MASIQTTAAKYKKTGSEATSKIGYLWVELVSALIIEKLGRFVGNNVELASPLAMEAIVVSVVSCISATILEMLGIRQGTCATGDIRGTLEGYNIPVIIRDTSLLIIIAVTKLATARAAAQKDFHIKWNRSIKEAMDIISERFSRLMIIKQAMMV